MILIWLLSHTPEYLATVNADAVEREFRGWGRRVVAAALKELESSGHLVRRRVPGPGGRVIWAPLAVRAMPESGDANTTAELPVSDGPSAERPYVDNPNHRAETTPPDPIEASTAEDDPPDPRPSLPSPDPSAASSTTGSKAGGESAPAVPAGADLVQTLIDLVRAVTGQTIDRDLAGKGVAMVLRAKDGTPRPVSDPVAYLRTAVETAPTRFLETFVPPRAGSAHSRPRRGFDPNATIHEPRGMTGLDIDPATGWPVDMNPGGRPLRRKETARAFEAEQARVTASGPAGDPSKLVCLTHPTATFHPDGTCPECRPAATHTAEPGWTAWMSAPTPRTASTGLPAWCGSCGGDAGHSPAVMQANPSYRTDTGRPRGTPCPRCHPDGIRASA
ncbi:hypothetical protein [Frankia sp. BMG5.23]|uniref:hypothetical protein n=1 Tax=Frankia sp. BMG5.23 TaxID=683305 RepID=UPI000461FA4C|nr:hypothetical protein [Frankia sp. BMG5.23]KDA44778.1 hypothetical protein BMG523Draft_00300 [Frankia sp. BMG5.23]